MASKYKGFTVTSENPLISYKSYIIGTPTPPFFQMCVFPALPPALITHIDADSRTIMHYFGVWVTTGLRSPLIKTYHSHLY
jgi:hypothetical protein